MRLALSCRPPLVHRDILVWRAASNPRASAPVCLQLHGEPAHARQDQNTHGRVEIEEAMAEADQRISHDLLCQESLDILQQLRQVQQYHIAEKQYMWPKTSLIGQCWVTCIIVIAFQSQKCGTKYLRMTHEATPQ